MSPSLDNKTLPPAINNDPCTRCKGSGQYHSERLHHGVPGLCMDCNGDGTGKTQRRIREASKALTARLEHQAHNRAKGEAPVVALRKRYGSVGSIPKERRDRIPVDAIFTTADYAERCGIPISDAFRELAVGYPQTQIAFNDLGNPIGWKREF